jgi:hypothetical protein
MIIHKRAYQVNRAERLPKSANGMIPEMIQTNSTIPYGVKLTRQLFITLNRLRRIAAATLHVFMCCTCTDLNLSKAE